MSFTSDTADTVLLSDYQEEAEREEEDAEREEDEYVEEYTTDGMSRLLEHDDSDSESMLDPQVFPMYWICSSFIVYVSL